MSQYIKPTSHEYCPQFEAAQAIMPTPPFINGQPNPAVQPPPRRVPSPPLPPPPPLAESAPNRLSTTPPGQDRPSATRNLETVTAFLNEKQGQRLNKIEYAGIVSLLQESVDGSCIQLSHHYNKTQGSPQMRINLYRFDSQAAPLRQGPRRRCSHSGPLAHLLHLLVIIHLTGRKRLRRC